MVAHEAQIAQRSCGHPFPGGAQGQAASGLWKVSLAGTRRSLSPCQAETLCGSVPQSLSRPAGRRSAPLAGRGRAGLRRRSRAGPAQLSRAQASPAWPSAAEPSRAVLAMAIAHIATEYVFSDFLLKEPPETRYKGLRLELALDKIVTCIAVGLPLLLISLAFAQEVSIGRWAAPLSRSAGTKGPAGRELPARLRLGSRSGPGRGRLRAAGRRAREAAFPEKPSRRASLAVGSSRCAALPDRALLSGHGLAAVLPTPAEQEPCQRIRQ